MILHGWVIREMVGSFQDIVHQSPVTWTVRTGRAGAGEVEDGGPDVLRERERERWLSVITVWSDSLGETWDKSRLALRLASHRQCSPDQFSAVWVAASSGLYLYNNINNNNTSPGHLLSLPYCPLGDSYCDNHDSFINSLIIGRAGEYFLWEMTFDTSDLAKVLRKKRNSEL